MLELWYEENWSSQTNKITNRLVSIHCAHGSRVTYPLAQVKIAVGDSSYEVEDQISYQYQCCWAEMSQSCWKC